MSFAHLRAWRQTSSVLRLDSAAGQVLRVLQYNVLADTLAEGVQEEIEGITCVDHFRAAGSAGVHYYQEPLDSCHVFRTCQDSLAWERRFPMIMAEIQHHSPDLICMQEVDHFTSMQEELQRSGFAGEFFKKKGRHVEDGSAIFWRTDKLHLLSRRGVHLGISIMTALMVRLATTDGVQFVACSTHLKAGFSSEMEEVRVKQVVELLKRIEEFSRDDPVILGADLNAHCAPYCRCNREQCCDPGELVEALVVPILESNGFRNAYGKYPSYTTWGGWLDRDVKATLDYVMIRGSISSRFALELPPDEAIAECPERLPNKLCPSDHLCLVADICLMQEASASADVQVSSDTGKGKRKNLDGAGCSVDEKGTTDDQFNDGVGRGERAHTTGGRSRWGTGWDDRAWDDRSWAPNWQQRECHDWTVGGGWSMAETRRCHRW